MEGFVYLPAVSAARFVRNLFFSHPDLGPCSCVLVTDCKTAGGPAIAHAFYVYESGDFLTGRPSFAVASEVNKMASPGEGRSHFLCVYPGEAKHENRGASDEWGDLEKFAARAGEIVMERFSLSEPLMELEVPTRMLREFQPPRSYPMGGEEPKKADGLSDLPSVRILPLEKKWWQFWK